VEAHDICELLPALKEIRVQGMFFITVSVKTRKYEEIKLYSYNKEKLYEKKPTFVCKDEGKSRNTGTRKSYAPVLYERWSFTFDVVSYF
jgi:hypothetical protein